MVKDGPSTGSGRAVRAALREVTERLTATSPTARLDAELLMARALSMTRSDMLLRAMDDPVPARFGAFVDRRARHEPVAYITGETEFYGLRLRVTEDTLIPRGDSEVLIDAALEHVGETGRAIDLGTGSGALLVALLADRAGWQGIGIDASARALWIARANANDHALAQRAVFYRRDWRKAGWADDLGTFDLILCNPPYVETGAPLEPQVRDYEPTSALFAGPEGLDDYCILIPQLRGLMRAGARAIVEIGATQAAAVTQLAQAAGFVVSLRNDLAGRARALVLS